MVKLGKSNTRTRTKKGITNKRTASKQPTKKQTTNKQTTNKQTEKKQAKKYTKNYTNKKKKTTRSKRKLFWKIIILLVLISTLYTSKSVFEFVEYQSSQSGYTMSGQDFIDKVDDIAIVEYRKSGILPSITVAQAILESNWGRSKLTQDANNLFGIKADSSWWGASMTFSTGEYYNSKVNAKFRKYRSWKHSIEDHTDFLVKNKRYSRAGIFDKKDYKSQAQALEDAGYATTEDKNGNKIYADKLIRLIERYNLYKLDDKVLVY
ncbi:MAG: glycoside hydrolase family 73 protein [Peptostreptococcus sp.]|uniref:glycoside hydrolase family 73 protein n=1 Tax=Peptostreptococcus TaxID=1257 RepID=UPI0029033974|nr:MULTISPECIES: glycoside hydrolase family 73 protein [Peptostreptococcus]MDU0964597.1 glycoside hydrolase family 73 protein [Peptostreptococcus anaerobius]MDU0998672.1 glycoside hydrolase family 73 protein [Peptostreptococcus anaerobius]MDU3423756.1 glycoside hydrolase family 73 protein [Peptostreptococcus anaerobius]MDU3430657.1 glycoside hydrolase family 73 protein [Peptostreptococcus sp.]MDU3455806.1 glycoside hydrolase family 73 protein [Peptostreptococcus sp.]